jgi:hypothetical protein
MRFTTRANGFIGGGLPVRILLPNRTPRENGWMEPTTRICKKRQTSLSCTDGLQVFFFSILRFSTISFRESKLETVRVFDFVPSFSACNS